MNKNQYDSFCDDYSKKTEEFDRETRKRFYETLPDLTEKKLLDVGCGSGHDAEYYTEQGAAVWGIDISEKQIELAKCRINGSFRVGDMNALPYEDGYFDIAISHYALQSSEDVPKSLSEMIRVTKAEGLIVVLAEHPFRSSLEGHVNDGQSDYFNQGIVTAYIFDRKIQLMQPGHTMMEYLNPWVLSQARIESFEEICDFPASDQVIPGLRYPTCMIVKYRKSSTG